MRVGALGQEGELRGQEGGLGPGLKSESLGSGTRVISWPRVKRESWGLGYRVRSGAQGKEGELGPRVKSESLG